MAFTADADPFNLNIILAQATGQSDAPAMGSAEPLIATVLLSQASGFTGVIPPPPAGSARIVLVGDVAGGAILNTFNITATINGTPLAVDGDAVAPHGRGPHNSATIVGTAGASLDGRRLVKDGDAATCGHTVAASSNSTVT